MISISYAITVCNELDEIKKLIPFLFEHKQEQDEVVVQYDRTSVTDDVMYYLDTLNGKIKIGSAPLNGNFASFKNSISKMCLGDYIFQLDADEIPNELLLQNIHGIIEDNDVDLIYVPRINTVDGLTQQHIDKWKWHVNSDGWINFPDYQSRLFRNKPEIKWINKVHEQIIGFKNFSKLPSYEQLCLYHHKTIERQERQNNFYETI